MNLDDAVNLVECWDKRLGQIILEDNGYTNFPMDKKGAEAILVILNKAKSNSILEEGIKDLYERLEYQKEESK